MDGLLLSIHSLLIVLCWAQGALAREYLEINYDVLPHTFYHANGSNVVYGPNDRMILGCMLPASASATEAFNERHNIMWGKDYDDAICGKIQTPEPCPWEEHTAKSRGMKQLSILLRADTHDNLEEGFAGSGSYRCYHTKDAYFPSVVRVYVAGTLLEMMVNSTKREGEIYLLPEKSVSDEDRKTLILECVIAAGARRLLPDKKILWYRNEQPLYPSGRFTFRDDLHKVLQIDKAESADDGVYMCEAELEQQNGKPITSRQYVVLQGDPVSVASSVPTTWYHQLLQLFGILLLMQGIVR